MSNFIYYEKLEDYEEQVKKAKLSDEKDKEIERLNNIINELEKWLEEQLMYFNENNVQGGFSTNVEDLEIVKDKLQELKGDDKE